MDDLVSLMTPRSPTNERPLLGVTVLVVEDSRFACEAVRLLCLRSGARIRRADCLASARKHLQVYRPTVVLIDLGLPDGSGADLIRELHLATPRVPVILATSGDDYMADLARDAGADGFLSKPIESLAIFQEMVLENLPTNDPNVPIRALPTGVVKPDPIAYRDDLAHIASILSMGTDDDTLAYIAQFLSGVAKSAHDEPMQKAATDLMELKKTSPSNVSHLADLVQDRLQACAQI
ncbi:response regulator [Cochlodiniinecator piscidefendens]|uniref:response regulator n=1 Tax=Cochlodiniinecator piscidefendens TaxID=2715756 RepID=UPI001408AF25|nr:response regulator [Cochlodiniinecator piscidefendens]